MSTPTPPADPTTPATTDPAETPETAEADTATERAARRDREKSARARAQALESERDTAIGERDGLRAELDSARAALESLQRHAIGALINPKDIGAQAFWKLNDDIGALLDADGRPNRIAIVKAVQATRVQLGLPRSDIPVYVTGMRLGVGEPPDGRTPSMADASRRRD